MSESMESFRIKIADRVFEIQTLSSLWKRQMSEFLTDESADYIVSVDAHVEDAEKEWMDIYCRIASLLLDDDILLFHGSCIALDGDGYLFTGPKGAGKSTHSRLWKYLFGDRAVIVNDDKPLLKMTGDGGVIAYGTPWAGKANLYCNMSVPLKAVAVINQADTNSIERIGIEESFPILFEETYRPVEDTGAVEKTLGLLDDFLARIGVFRLNCNMQPDAARVAYEAMSQ